MIKATIFLSLAAWIIPRLRTRSAAERHLLWAIGLLAAALTPLIAVVVPSWQPDWAQRALSMVPGPFRVAPQWTAGASTDVVVRASGIEASTFWTVGRLVALAWAGGAAVAFFLLALEFVKLARLAADAHPCLNAHLEQRLNRLSRTLGLKRTIRLLQTSHDIVPATWGWRRPRILLPTRAAEWPEERAHVVLAHEMAHIRRHDWIVHLAAEAVCAVYWFHPLFWLAKRRLCHEAEHAADDVVVKMGVRKTEYATHLIEIVRAMQTPVRAWSPTVAMARSSQLAGRVAALLSHNVNRDGMTASKAVGALGATVLIVVPLAALTWSNGPIDISIHTNNLPTIDNTSAAGPPEPAAPVKAIRLVDRDDRGGSIMRPEVLEYTTPPLYSDEARARGIEGVVTVRARVERDGRVTAVKLIKGLGFGVDENAVVAVRQWKFRPGIRAGVAMAMWADIDVEFSLSNESVNALIANDMATRVGPGVTPPRAVHVAEFHDRGLHAQGTVVLDVVLLENGVPRIVRVLRSLGPELDDLAVRRFEQWRFSPAMKDGRPVKVRMNAEVNFHG